MAAAIAAGCGYHFAAAGTGLPASARTIYVERFGNHSRIAGLNDQFARYIKDEIANHKRLQLVDDPGQADLRLSGALLREDTSPTTYNGVDEPTQYSAIVLVDAMLTDNRTKKMIWKGRMSSGAFYGSVSQAVVATDPLFLQQNLRGQDIAKLTDAQTEQTQYSSAQDQMMTDLAHNLYADMSEGF